MNPQAEHAPRAGSRKTSENLLNAGAEIQGTLKFSGELTFDGKIDGEIQTDGTLHLGNNAVIKGNINALTVVVRGKIKGNIVATDKIDIKANTELFGDIRASKLTMEEGVTFEGRTQINPKKVAATAPPPLRPTDVPKISEPAHKSVGH